LAELQDYQSVSRVTGSLLLNEEMIQYKGDTFEKVFINAFLALNFLKLNRYDDALVEVRRMNEKYNKNRLDKKKSFEINPFSRYLAALIYEATQKWDDAYIAYQETYKIDPSIPTLKEDLLRSSYRARRQDEHARWKDTFSDIKFKQPQDKNKGEIVLLYLQGWGPRKKPDPLEPLFPTLEAVHNQTQKAQLLINGEAKTVSQLVYDTQSAAISTLAEDRAALVARRVAARIAREAAARELSRSQNDKAGLLGAVAFIGMQISERADLRQWSFLPASIHIARLTLDPGDYDAQVLGQDEYNQPTGEKSKTQNIKIKPGKTQFIVWRSVK
jgi:uncharacterized protein